MVVIVDYFIKWVEAESLASINPMKIKEFVYRNIVYECEILHPIVSDNNKQLTATSSRNFAILGRSISRLSLKV